MRPRSVFSIGLVLFLLLSGTAFVSAAPFSDVEGENKAAIDYLLANGVVNGYADGTFKPGNAINRAELLKMLVGSVGLTPQLHQYHDCFPDMMDQWFAPFVCYAKEKGWVNGYPDGNFKPEKSVNTVEAIKMIVNTYGYQAMQTASTAPYGDMDPSAWYAPYVLLARAAGILDTMNGQLGVSRNITRGQVSGIMYRSMKNRNEGTTTSTATDVPSITQRFFNRLRRGGGGSGESHAGISSQSSSDIVLSSPTITFGTLTKNYGDTAFALSPTSNSAGAFSFESSNTAVATVSSNTVTIVGAGVTTITVTQASNGDYASGSASATLTVSAIAPTLGTFGNITKQMGDIPFTLTAPTSNSAGAFSYESSNTDVATIAGSTVTLVSNGSATITATQAANGNYTSGTKTLTLTVAVGECFTAPCLNGGVCTNEPGGEFSCACSDGYSGSTCDLDASNCAEGSGMECLNGGTCNPTAAHGECACPTCYFGLQCDLFDSVACA